MSTEPFSIKTDINYYYTPPETVAPPVYYVGTAGARRMKYDSRKREIFNLRGRENHFTVDKNGFQFLKYPLNEDVKLYDDEEKVKELLYPRFEELVKKNTGCTSVYIFGHIVRRMPHAEAMESIKGLDDFDKVKPGDSPAMFAHVDQSPKGAEKLVREIHRRNPDLEAVAQKSQKYRWGIINIWRPLKPISREPLAVCDGQTVKDSDLQEVLLRVPVDYRRPDMPVEENPSPPYESWIWQLKPSQGQRWYCPFRMTPDEALLIKCFDSRQDGKTARRAPHSAITTPMDQGPPRESVEIRCICFWEDEPKDGVGAKL